MPSTKQILTILILIMSAASLLSEERIYREKEGTHTATHRFNITQTTTGFTIHLSSEKETGTITQTFILDSNMRTLNWEYDDPQEKTKVQASRSGTEIQMSGTDRGKTVRKTFEVDNRPWNQTFNIGLEHFAASKASTFIFWAIGVKGPGNMKITRFKAKRKNIEPITLSFTNQKEHTVHITISLTGLLSMFWTGHYWYRENTGTFLRYNGKNKRNGPVAEMQLISEKQ